MEVLFFGQLAELTGVNSVYLEDAQDTNSLLEELNARFPALAGSSIAIAVNKRIVHENTTLHSGNSIALLPPFSGG